MYSRPATVPPSVHGCTAFHFSIHILYTKGNGMLDDLNNEWECTQNHPWVSKCTHTNLCLPLITVNAGMLNNVSLKWQLTFLLTSDDGQWLCVHNIKNICWPSRPCSRLDIPLRLATCRRMELYWCIYEFLIQRNFWLTTLAATLYPEVVLKRSSVLLWFESLHTRLASGG